MNLPGFEKGEVLRAADLQALSDAVARTAGRGAAGRFVGEARGVPAWQHELRTPILHAGQGRVAEGFDKPRDSESDGGCCDAAYGKPVVAGFGFHMGAPTRDCDMRSGCDKVLDCTWCGWTGGVYQSIMVRNDGTAVNITEPFRRKMAPEMEWCDRTDRCERPLPQKWWGDDGQDDGGACGAGSLSVLVGCMRVNMCSSNACGGAELRPGVGLTFRGMEQVQIPHMAANAGGCEDGAGLVLRPEEGENVSRVRRLAAGAGVSLAVEEDAVSISACGGGLRPINPPGCGGCKDGCCEGEPVGCCCSAAAKTPAPVELVGAEWPAGAPVGVIIRQLVGLGGAKVRRHVEAEGEAQGKYRCVVDVVAKVPVNAWDVCCCGWGDVWPAGACVPVQRMRLVTGCEEHTCCRVPLRVLELRSGLRGEEAARGVRLWALPEVANCTAGLAGACARPGVCGWVQSLSVRMCERYLPWNCCMVTDEGSMRQLMRYWVECSHVGELQVVQQVKLDGVWQRFEPCFI